MPSQEILKIRDGTPLEAEEILTYIKKPSKRSIKLDVPSNVVHKKKVARILLFKIRPSQEILKIRDGTPLEAEEILTYIKKSSKRSICYFSSKLDIPCNVVQKKRVARILFFKIRPSQEILKIRDGIPLEAEEIMTYIKSPRNGSVCYFSSKLDNPSNVVQKKKVARILLFKIRPSQEILKIRDGTPLEAEEILTYIKKCSKRIDVPSNVVQKKKVARILLFKIRPSQEILKIRDGTPLEAEEILTYIKKPSKRICLPSQEILKIRDGTPLEAEEILTYIKKPSKRSWPSQEILKIRDGTPLELDVPSNVVHKKKVARILLFKIRPSQEILKIRDGTPLEAEEILTYIKKSSKRSICYFSSKLDIPSNVVQKKRVARILFFKIRPSQEILKIRDGIPLEAEEIMTYIKSPRNGSVCYFSSKLDNPSNVVQKKKVARILLFKIRPSQEILKIRDGTPLEAEEILTYIKKPSKRIDVPSNVVQKKKVARILLFKIRPSQEILKIRDGTPLERKILKIRDGTPLEAEEILTYIKKPSKRSWPSQEILKIRDGTPLELDVPSNVVHKKKVARILLFKIRPSQEILKIRDGTPLEAEEILTYIKKSSKRSICYFSSKLDIPSNVVQKKRVARILFFKIRPSQEILKIRDGIPLEAEEIMTYIKSPRNGSVCYFSSKLDNPSNVVQKKKVARILLFKIRPSQEILKIRDGTPLEAEEILTYIKKPSKRIVARILLFKIRPSQEILKIRDGTPLEKKRVARILFFKIRPSQEILKIRDGIPLEAEEIMTYIKSPRNGSVCYFSSKLDNPSNVVQKKKVARILLFKIRPSQEILKIRDGTPLEAEEILTYIKKCSKRIDVPSNVVQKKKVARILLFKIRPSQEILKIRDGTPLEKTVARILFSKIRPSQEILKIRDGTPLEAEEILTYIKKPSKRIEILKIRDGTPLEAEEILTYIKKPSKRSVCYLYSKFDIPSNVVQKKRVARILFSKIRPSQEI
ncbi:hypothetical protein OROHE_004126 [Orobanche hederae]